MKENKIPGENNLEDPGSWFRRRFAEEEAKQHSLVSQVGEGLKRGISLEYAGEKAGEKSTWPEYLANEAGMLVGSAPAFSAASLITGPFMPIAGPLASPLVRAAVDAFVVGAAQNPEGEQLNRLKNAAAFGVGTFGIGKVLEKTGILGEALSRWGKGGPFKTPEKPPLTPKEMPETPYEGFPSGMSPTQRPVFLDQEEKISSMPEEVSPISGLSPTQRPVTAEAMGISPEQKEYLNASPITTRAPAQMEFPFPPEQTQPSLPFEGGYTRPKTAGRGFKAYSRSLQKTPEGIEGNFPFPPQQEPFNFMATSKQIEQGVIKGWMTPDVVSDLGEVASAEHVLGPIFKTVSDNAALGTSLKKSLAKIAAGEISPTREALSDTAKAVSAFEGTPVEVVPIAEHILSPTATLLKQKGLQKEMETILTKTKVDPAKAMKALTTNDPVENLMASGMTYGDAGKFVDTAAERGSIPLTKDLVGDISHEVKTKIQSPILGEPQVIVRQPLKGLKMPPSFESVKDKVFPPGTFDHIFDMYDLLGDEEGAVAKGLLEAVNGGYKVTDTGYHWFRLYYSDAFTPSNVSAAGLKDYQYGAIHGRGESNVVLSRDDLTEMGWTGGFTQGKKLGILWDAPKIEGIEDGVILTPKGAAWLSGLKGAQGAKGMQEMLLQTGRRAVPEARKEIGELGRRAAEDRRILADVIKEQQAGSTVYKFFTPDCL